MAAVTSSAQEASPKKAICINSRSQGQSLDTKIIAPIWPPLSHTKDILDSTILPSARFRGDQFREDIHTATYRCRARNRLGAIVSRLVRVKAGKATHVHNVLCLQSNDHVVTAAYFRFLTAMHRQPEMLHCSAVFHAFSSTNLGSLWSLTREQTSLQKSSCM